MGKKKEKIQCHKCKKWFDSENINKIFMPSDFMPNRISGYIFICDICKIEVERKAKERKAKETTDWYC